MLESFHQSNPNIATHQASENVIEGANLELNKGRVMDIPQRAEFSSEDELCPLKENKKSFYDLQDLIDGILEDKLKYISTPTTDESCDHEARCSKQEDTRQSEQIKRIYQHHTEDSISVSSTVDDNSSIYDDSDSSVTTITEDSVLMNDVEIESSSLKDPIKTDNMFSILLKNFTFGSIKRKLTDYDDTQTASDYNRNSSTASDRASGFQYFQPSGFIRQAPNKLKMIKNYDSQAASQHSILKKIDVSGSKNKSKAKMRKKMGCFYVADVYSQENLAPVPNEKRNIYTDYLSKSPSRDSLCSKSESQVSHKIDEKSDPISEIDDINHEIELEGDLESVEARYPFPKCGIRKRKRMSKYEKTCRISDPGQDVTENQLDECRPLRSQLYQNQSLNYEEPRRLQIVQKSNSLPKGLNQSSAVPHGTSPLVQSRSRYSINRQGTVDTDVESLLFKRTPIDLMKQNASLLTNIICLAITLSLVLVTVVQFSGNEERWERWNKFEDGINKKVNKLSADTDGLYEDTTQQASSVQEMELLLFGENNGTSLANLTNIGVGMIQTIAQMKKWYLNNSKMLKTLSAQSKDMVMAKNLHNTVFGRGTQLGVVDRLQVVESTVRDVRDRLNQEMGKWQSQFVELRAEVRDLRGLLNTSIAMINRVKTDGKTQRSNITRRIDTLYNNIKKQNGTIHQVKEKTSDLAQILEVALTNISVLDDRVRKVQPSPLSIVPLSTP